MPRIDEVVEELERSLQGLSNVQFSGPRSYSGDRFKRLLAIAQIAVKLDADALRTLADAQEHYVTAGICRSHEQARIALWSALIGMGGIRPSDLADDL